MRLQIRHHTTYSYDEPVPYGLQQARVTPRTSQTQFVQDWSTTIRGGQVHVNFSDQHLNLVTLIGIDQDASSIEVVSEGIIVTSNVQDIEPVHTGFAPLWLYQRSTSLTAGGPGVDSLLQELASEGGELDDVSQIHRLSAIVSERVRYQPGSSESDSTAEAAIAAGEGVCQDHAHILISAARKLNRPARYVSGYLMMDDQVDHSATHAWAEIWINNLGWVGLDASNGISPDERYVRIATGLDYLQAAPLSGVRYGGGVEEMTVDVQVQVQQ